MDDRPTNYDTEKPDAREDEQDASAKRDDGGRAEAEKADEQEAARRKRRPIVFIIGIRSTGWEACFCCSCTRGRRASIRRN